VEPDRLTHALSLPPPTPERAEARESTEMTKRPKAVTVIGWFLRVGGIIGMIWALPFALWGQDLYGDYWVDALRRLSPTVLFLWAFSSSLLCLLFGNGILKGQNWARILTLAYCVFAKGVSYPLLAFSSPNPGGSSSLF